MLKIGKAGGTGAQGFSLLEILLSVVILSVGLVAMNRVLIGSVMALAGMSSRSEARRFAADKIWELQDISERLNQRPGKAEEGRMTGGDKTYQYEVLWKPLQGIDSLMEGRLQISWREGGLTKRIQRVFYAHVPLPKKG